MDESQNHGGSQAVTLVRSFWTLLSPSNVLITCGMYRTSNGYEVRAGQGEGDASLLRQEVFTDAIAETYAAGWKSAALVQGYRDVTDAAAAVAG